MSVETTFGIIKPDAVRAGHIGHVLTRIQAEGFRIRGMKLAHLTPAQAAGFYHVHDGKPFFKGLIEFMTSGPCVLLAFERENAIQHWRGVMGKTNPADADQGTLRKELGTELSRNAVHGSDATDTAAFEVGYFFNGAFELLD